VPEDSAGWRSRRRLAISAGELPGPKRLSEAEVRVLWMFRAERSATRKSSPIDRRKMPTTIMIRATIANAARIQSSRNRNNLKPIPFRTVDKTAESAESGS
jgi:hypothetical protein